MMFNGERCTHRKISSCRLEFDSLTCGKHPINSQDFVFFFFNHYNRPWMRTITRILGLIALLTLLKIWSTLWTRNRSKALIVIQSTFSTSKYWYNNKLFKFWGITYPMHPFSIMRYENYNTDIRSSFKAFWTWTLCREVM